MTEKRSLGQDWRDVFRLMDLVRKRDASVLPLTILRSLADAWAPYIQLFFTARLLDRLVAGDYRGGVIAALWLLGSGFLLQVIRQYLDSGAGYWGVKTLCGMILTLREKAMGLDYQDISDPAKIKPVVGAERQANFNGDIEDLVRLLGDLLKNILACLTSLGLFLHLCFAKGTATGLLAALTAPLPSILSTLLMLAAAAAGFLWFEHRMQHRWLQNEDEHVDAENALTYLMSKVFCSVPAGKVIRLFSMSPMLAAALNRYAPVSRKVYADMGRNFLRSDLMSQLLGGVFLVFSYGLVLLKVLAGAISIGAFTQYVGALAALQKAVQVILQRNERVRMMMRYFHLELDFLVLPSTHTGTIPVEKRLDHVYELEFHHVSFAYPGSTEYVLKDLSCKLDLKEKMAVVGPNGAGKTTFIKLLTRLYDPTEGYITLNGVDIRKYDYGEYLSLFSVVFQDYQLFPCPIGENVASSRDYDQEKVWRCLRQAGVEERIQSMKLDLSTPLNPKEENGEALSGGEAQKVAIARALYKDAPLVILDEPTAALDPLSEYEIYSRFDQLVADKTSVYISHRMSSCRFCTDIMVFQDGRIVQRGSHDKLVAEKGLYAELWNAQATYYKP